MRTKWIFATLIIAAALAAFWFLKPKPGGGDLGPGAYALTGEILAHGPRPPGSPGLDKVRSLLSAELKQAGWVVVLQEFEQETPIGKVKFANLRARFPAKSGVNWESKVEGLLCAHVDSKFFKDKVFLGADDAASACAAVVEIGKYLAREKPDQAAKLELVLFDGEEAFTPNMNLIDGVYGSRFYANSWRGSDAKPSFGLLLDMIGHKNLSIRIPSDSPENLAERMFAAAKENGVSRHFGTAQGSLLDDHVPLNLVGIPTLDIIGNFQILPWWHQAGDPKDASVPSDDMEVISAESLSISIGVVLHMLDGLLAE